LSKVLERMILSAAAAGSALLSMTDTTLRPRLCGRACRRVDDLDQGLAPVAGKVALLHQLHGLLVGGVLDALHQVLRGAHLGQRLAAILDREVGALSGAGWGRRS